MALGVTLAPYGKIPNAWPWGILRSYGANGHYMEPADPQYYRRGEAGYYYDTQFGRPYLNWLERWRIKRQYKALSKQASRDRSTMFMGLGIVPTDAELAVTRGFIRDNVPRHYTPWEAGWIATCDRSKNECNTFQQGPWLPPNGRRFDGGTGVGLGDASAEDLLAVTQAHNDRILALSIVSTVAVSVSAMITVFRTLKLIKEDK